MRVGRDALALFVLLFPATSSAQATASFPDLDAAATGSARPAAERAPNPPAVRPPPAETRRVPPSGADYLVERAERHVAQGQLTRALVDYTDALRLDPRNGRAWLGLGNARERLGQFAEAEAVYTRACRITPITAEALYRRGLLYSRRGSLERAARDLYASANIEALPPRLQALADVYVKLRAWPAALAAWRRLYGIEPDEEGARKARRLIAALEILVGDMDPVKLGRDTSWIRRALYENRPH